MKRLWMLAGLFLGCAYHFQDGTPTLFVANRSWFEPVRIYAGDHYIGSVYAHDYACLVLPVGIYPLTALHQVHGGATTPPVSVVEGEAFRWNLVTISQRDVEGLFRVDTPCG